MIWCFFSSFFKVRFVHYCEGKYTSTWNHHCSAPCIVHSVVHKLQARGCVHHWVPLLPRHLGSAEAELVRLGAPKLEDDDSNDGAQHRTKHKDHYCRNHSPGRIACGCEGRTSCLSISQTCS